MDQELKTYLEGFETRLTTKMHDLVESSETRLTTKMHDLVESTETRLIEKMRDMQTELLRGFEAFSSSQTIRLRKLEVDQSTSTHH